MPYIELDTHGGSLGFDIQKEFALVSAYRGRDTEITVPETIEYLGNSFPVTGIAKKAFLSNRYLHFVSVSKSVKSIADWAFAGCRNLESVSIHADIELENGVFKDCNNLKKIHVSDSLPDDIDYLLAAVIFLLEDKYLIDFKNAGSDQWLTNWDNRVRVILAEPDEEGFSDLLACGEEDYEGRDNTIEAYLSRRRKRKVRVCLMRLLHNISLESELKDKLISYLQSYGPEKDERETWEVVLEEHGDELEYYELLCKYDIINRNNLERCLKDMGQFHARMKAFLLRECGSNTGDNIFDDMDL